ncbi:ornithine cyclodeaminase family protein [Roseovarius aestuarii]|uniref:L-lysine cyclodeaminase n=1 Tax=Roseovarius aestuarii TaxID=475083 RepID=A0A1X7BV72_9RHOB|nr:ornithine cyclodeaminase family protein [Roseovarius aestuarii]SMC13556.1 L-lysine cyclodeaminase [Roseovarius aestuarii]
MIRITEEQSAAIATHELAYEAVREAFVASVAAAAKSFPVVIGHASDPQNRFTIKSAADGSMAGVKVGSYFPTNDEVGLPRHNSLILLFNQEKGSIGAVVEAGKLNAYRTAAADAVATDALARADAKVLTLFGTGNQAEYEAHAIAKIRSLQRILIVGRSEERTSAFAEKLSRGGLPAEACEAETACRQADIIVTATTSKAPLFRPEWVQPGTHISSMGSDGGGKQELPPELFSAGRLFCDLPEQSLRIGEFQHTAADTNVVPIGDVLKGTVSGRESESEITVFDSSGISLQDLYIAEKVIAAHLSKPIA